MYSHADKQTAWDMFVELSTNIAIRDFKGGKIISVIANIVSLFACHRQIARK